ncbi:MAG TPA: hypothetical protein VHG35_01155, partial [Gemmatimonadales bacterium]|nr:hypothetical protein [Gemmatimonadales bacterium]
MEQETTRAAAPAGPAEPRDETVAEDDGVGVAEHHGIGSRRLFSLTSQLRRQRPPSQTQAWVRSQAEAAKAGNDTFRSGSDDAPAGPSDGTNGNGTSAAAEAPAEEAQVAGAPSGGTGARRATAPAAAAPRPPARP